MIEIALFHERLEVRAIWIEHWRIELASQKFCNALGLRSLPQPLEWFPKLAAGHRFVLLSEERSSHRDQQSAHHEQLHHDYLRQRTVMPPDAGSHRKTGAQLNPRCGANAPRDLIHHDDDCDGINGCHTRVLDQEPGE